ncbi:MAG: Unknown protein [uncultured Sulfurovum sp.]|uniref:Translocation and assembly module TamB C-terminal domain-containing protein n=1 Tax=uncultured Sulfurovum sp. TaxID=269237 RepID=A0A6S6S605_9BACT|nr:MAG: Unknown protein [uncultured Sulfurovum sp.]
MYWTIVSIEVLLLLVALLLFIVTDSRTIKYIAQSSMESSKLNYGSIEGNIFSGLDVKRVTYDDKPLFDSALIYWNPLSLFYDKVTIRQIDAQGVEIDNILLMLNDLDSNSDNEGVSLDYSFELHAAHFDINPYVYEGVKFSSFVFETGKIEVAKDFNLNSDALYLKFDSDLVNLSLNGKIEDSVLLVDELNLKNISAGDITRLTRRIKSNYVETEEVNVSIKNENNSQSFIPIKEIKVKQALGTMKKIQYGDLKIQDAELRLYDGTINPSNNFNYQFNKLDFRGKTNFGSLNYKGHVKDSMIEAKGEILLDKSLFKKYALALNFKNLKSLPSKLRLNHDAVWIDIEHKVNNLLELKNDFNLNVSKATHELYYDYESEVFTIDSNLVGDMTYANEFKLENKVQIDEENFFYTGNVEVKQVKSLPKVVSEYLLTELNGDFKGGSDNFEIELKSTLLDGHFSMPNYKNGILALKSKSNDILLGKLVPDIPAALQNEKIAFESKSSLDFKNFERSEIELDVQSNTLAVEAKMRLFEPYKISFLSQIKNDRLLKEMLPKVKFSKLQNFEGDVLLYKSDYLINIQNDFLKLFMKYDTSLSTIQDVELNLEGETFNFETDNSGALAFNSKIKNIQSFLDKIKSYYEIEIPNIRGEADLKFHQQSNGTIYIELKSPKLQYLSDGGVNLEVTNFENVELAFSIDESSKIIIDNYQFKIDDNGYINLFASTKKSYLSLNNNILNITQFWLNDEIQISGEYDTDSLKGNLKINTDSYTLRTKDFTLILATDLSVKTNNMKFEIDGDIDILGDIITYELAGTDIVEDSDIIIMKDMLKTKESIFNNFKLYIKVKSKKALRYIADDVNIEFFNELSIVKNYNQEMLITGMSTITKGTYQLEDKEFSLDESHLYFTGDIKKPLLDIKANYIKDQYTVHVYISGTTENPIVNFNSEPFLTQQEILSLILFDGTGSSSGKGAEAYTLLGGTFAKGLIKSLGIDVDHLLLGTDAEEELSLEIGKRISDNISVLYLHKDGLDGAKVRIEHSESFETDIIIQPPNTSSIEFLYKRDR